MNGQDLPVASSLTQIGVPQTPTIPQQEPSVPQNQVTTPAPDVLPSVSPIYQPISTVKPTVQEFPRSKRKMLLIFGIVIVLFYIVGFAGTRVYFHFLKRKSIPAAASQSTTLPPSFAIFDTIKIHTDDEAIEAVKIVYPELRSVEKLAKSVENGTKDEPSINTRSFKNGWKLIFTKSWGACSKELEGCEHLQIHYFVVHYDGTVKKIGEFEHSVDINNPGSGHATGTLIPFFLTNEDSY